MISAVDEIDAVARAIELGATDYLPKPFNAVVLRARVTATLEKKRLEDAARQQLQSLERELEIGRQIQKDFLPDELPRPAGWEIAAAFEPARQVAGDFYDAFALEDGRVALVVGDVCDKGVGAALFMGLFRSLLRSHAELHGAGTPAGPAARSIVALTNDYIARTHGRSNMFATLFFGLLDPATGALACVNAGLEPQVVRRRDGAIERLLPTGPAVGALPDMEFTANTLELGPGDLLLAFTDGASEARSPAGKFYGEDSLIGLLEAAPADLGSGLGIAGGRPHPRVRLLPRPRPDVHVAMREVLAFPAERSVVVAERLLDQIDGFPVALDVVHGVRVVRRHLGAARLHEADLEPPA